MLPQETIPDSAELDHTASHNPFLKTEMPLPGHMVGGRPQSPSSQNTQSVAQSHQGRIFVYIQWLQKTNNNNKNKEQCEGDQMVQIPVVKQVIHGNLM